MKRHPLQCVVMERPIIDVTSLDDLEYFRKFDTIEDAVASLT